MSRMLQIKISLDERHLQALDRLMEIHGATSRSEAVRSFLREFNLREERIGDNASLLAEEKPTYVGSSS